MAINMLDLIQTLSIVLAIIIALVTLKGKGDAKTSALTEMMVDIKYIKESVKCIEPLKDRINDVERKAQSAFDLITLHVQRHTNEGG